MIYATNFQSKHFLVLPSSDFRSPNEINFIITLSGVAIIDNFKGAANGAWHTDIIHMSAYDMGMDKVLTRVTPLLPALPPSRPDGSWASWVFVPLQWTVHTSFNSIYNAGTSVNAGYEIDDWKIVRADRIISSSNTIITFEGFEVNLSVSDRDGEIKKIGYDANLHGYFAVVWNSPI